MKIDSESDFQRWFSYVGWKRFGVGQRAVIINTSSATRLPVGHPDVVMHAYDEEHGRHGTYYIEMKWVHKENVIPKHPFSAAQLMMLSKLRKVGVHAWGLIGCKETGTCIVLSIPSEISIELMSFFDNMTFASARTSRWFSLEISLS